MTFAGEHVVNGAPGNTGTVEKYLFATGGHDATTPAAMATGARYGTSAAGNSTNAFVLGGVGTMSTENYIFATGQHDAMTPAALSTFIIDGGASSNETKAFLFGGSLGNNSSTTNIEAYIFSTGAHDGVSPTSLSTPRVYNTAASNSTRAYIAGEPVGTMVGSVESIIFATGQHDSTTPALLVSKNSHGMSSASNNVNAFFFGTGPAWALAENYSFATGLHETAPASLAVPRINSAGASNNTIAMILGGISPTDPSGSTLDIVETYTFSTRTRGSLAATLNASRARFGAADNRSFA
jgi:hypothetical protein